MRNIKLILALLFALSFVNQSFADGHQNHINLNHCYANDDAVFILVGNRWLGAEAMQCTPQGVFVMEDGEWKMENGFH